MSKYIETATDLNIEGIEFFVKNSPDGYLYEDEGFLKRANYETIKHEFEMNDIVIIDNGVAYRPTSLALNNGVATLTYFVVSGDNVVAKQVTSFDHVLSLDADIDGEEDLFGKVVSDLQENVEADDNKIIGTLKFVEDYTGFDADPELQKGNFLAIHCETNGEDPIFVELVGGFSGPVQLDADGIIVLRIANKNQYVRVTSGELVREYSLTDLVLNEE